MKCKLCGNTTDWNSSYGRLNFIVCEKCMDELTRFIKKDIKYGHTAETLSLEIILKIGFMREKNNINR